MTHAAKRFFILLFAVLLSACGEAPPRFSAVPAGAVVLAFGDSVTHGTGAMQGEDFPSRLAERTGWEVTNAGIPGDTTDAAKARVGTALQDITPALVIVELGGNDFLRRRDPVQVKEDLRAILRAVKAANAIPVLVAVPAFSAFAAGTGALADAPLYAELAKEEKVLLVKDAFSKVLSDPALRTDPIHPNGEGYKVLADGIVNTLAASGLLGAR